MTPIYSYLGLGHSFYLPPYPPSSNLSSSSASIAKAPFTSSASHFFIPQALSVIHVVLLIILVFSYLSCVLSSSTFLSLCISYLSGSPRRSAYEPLSECAITFIYCKGTKVSGKMPILDTLSERRPWPFASIYTNFRLYARQSLVNFFSAQNPVPLHGDSCEVRSCAKAILVAWRLLCCFE